jgi:hypothetical protein
MKRTYIQSTGSKSTKIHKWLFVALLILFSFANLYAADYTVEQWRVVEISLTSSESYTDPLNDVDVTAIFSGPDGITIVRPAFWDGGTSWKVRFAPTVTGNWTMTTTSTITSNAGLQNISKTIQCNAYTDSLEIYKHGFLKVSPNKRYMVYNDESPFFWLGDTHWQMFDYERDDECNYGDNCGSQFKHVVKDRMAKGFTVYQTYPDAGVNDGGGNAHVANWWSTKYTRLDPVAFQKYFDPKMKYLADNGFVVALGCGVHWRSTESVGLTGMKLLAKYMVARYGAYPVVWITGQEVDIKPEEAAIWKEVAKTIDSYDGYKHPLTGHMSPTKYTWGDETWHTWFAVQGGHGTTRTYCSQALYKGYWNYLPTQPFLESEAKYEDVDCGGLNDATDERVAAYKSIQCGSLGFTYGVSGIWAMKWDTKVAGWDSYSKYPWYVGVDAPGSTYMKYLKQFYTSFAWEKLVPRFSDPAWCSFVNPETAILSSMSDAERFVVYFYNTSITTGILKNLSDSKTYSARWFNPTTGKSILISDAIRSTGGIYTIPSKPDTKDWLLLVEDVNAKSSLPVGEDQAVSLNKTTMISSSSASGFTGTQAVDNSSRTYWCAANGTFPQWLSVDLGVNTKLSLIQTKFYANEQWKYKIEGSEDNSNWSSLANHTAGANGYFMNDTVRGNFRYVRLTVTGASVDWAAVREFTVFSQSSGQSTGVNEIALLNEGGATLSTFPNPSKGRTNIIFSLQKPSQAEIQIFNSRGQLIESLGSSQYSSGVHSLVWEASQQPNGIYLAVLKMNNKMLRSKIVKIFLNLTK